MGGNVRKPSPRLAQRKGFGSRHGYGMWSLARDRLLAVSQFCGELYSKLSSALCSGSGGPSWRCLPQRRAIQPAMQPVVELTELKIASFSLTSDNNYQFE